MVSQPESRIFEEFRARVVVGVTVLGIFPETIIYNEPNELNQ
jgi:hypothetical protein